MSGEWVSEAAHDWLVMPISRAQHIELIRHANIPPLQRLRELFNVGLRGAELHYALRPAGVTFKRAVVREIGVSL